MIYGMIDQSAQYMSILREVDRVLTEAKRYTQHDEFGRKIALEGDDLYLNLAEYDSHEKTKGCMEAHRQYIDVMCMIAGEETIYVKPTVRLRHIIRAYDAEKDALLAEIDDDCCAIRLQAGEFVVLFPEDAHAPACWTEQQSHVKKIIGKVRI